MSKISLTIDGNVTFDNGKLYIDGVEIMSEIKELHDLVIKGNFNQIGGDLTVNGNVTCVNMNTYTENLYD